MLFLSAVWRFFSMVFVCCFIANLTAYLSQSLLLQSARKNVPLTPLIMRPDVQIACSWPICNRFQVIIMMTLVARPLILSLILSAAIMNAITNSIWTEICICVISKLQLAIMSDYWCFCLTEQTAFTFNGGCHFSA